VYDHANILYYFDLLGTLAFAISGAMSAAEKRLDLFGAGFVAFVTAVGGGTVRDSILGYTPVAWLQDPVYFYIIIMGVATAFVFKQKVLKLKKALFFFDTVGISVFTIIGLERGLSYDIHPPLAIMMGTVSAVVGGILRDVLCNDIPLIFKKEIYATACVLGGVIFVLLMYLGLPDLINTIITTISIFLIRTLSIRFNWTLPKLGQ